MRVVELQNALLAALATALGERGFRYIKKEQHFRQKGESATFYLHIAFVQHVADVDAIADVAVTYQLPGEEHGVTIGVELGNWTEIGQHRWRVAALADAPGAAADIVHWFERIAVPFFERFRSPAEALAVLEANGREADLVSPFPEYRERSRNRLRMALAKDRG